MPLHVEPCPHVSTAMIAAGFHRCAVCEKNPAAMKESTSAQELAVARAFEGLADALGTLAKEATTAAKACGRKRPAPDMDRMRAAWRDVDLAEQAVDTAVYDLQTAKGSDG